MNNYEIKQIFVIIVQRQYNLKEMSKVRKVYNLRKTSNIKPQPPPQQSRLSQFRDDLDHPMKASQLIEKNMSIVSLNQNLKQTQLKNIQQLQPQYQVEGQQLVISSLQLNFDVPINDIDKKSVRIKNIGSSAIYLQFNFKNHAKINSSGFKDTKLKFYCHYQNMVIKPAQQTTFFFSFLSDFPGNFTEEVEISCQPPLRTKIPNLKLNARAYILDEWQDRRTLFNSSVNSVILNSQVAQILNDVVSQVKLPPPARPDVTNIKVAQLQFQKQNQSLNLFFNEYLHNWFNQLFNQICQKAQIPPPERYWDQSVQTLKQTIDTATYLDEVEKKCYNDRLEHYCYLSLTPPTNKSELYQTVFQFLSSTAHTLGGDFVDAARKELDMWEVPFREPLQSDTAQELKARKEEVDKIKAQWVKKAKKKKWGEEEEKEMVNQFKKKVQARTTENVLNKFTNFQESAQFIKTREFLKKSNFTLVDYQRYLERVKTVKQYPLDGKKVLIKWHLKLKNNIEQKLKQLQQYLAKKQEQQKRLQQQKKQGSKKKKAPPKPKKKGQKQQQQQKPLHFDFMSILDQQNWNGFLQTFRIVMEKQPFLLLIGVTYGPRTGRHLPEYSVHFILQHLKTLQTSIEFFPHDQLPSLQQKIQNQTISQGSILLMENLNFLPWEVTQQEVVQLALEGSPAKITKRKLLHPQIREFFDNFGQSIDVLVNEDRYLQQLSGFSAYLNKEIIMGTQWWRYVGLSTRIIGSTVVFGEDFSPQSLLLLYRLIYVAKAIYLTGKTGLKFFLVIKNLAQLGNIHISQTEKQQITKFIANVEHNKLSQKLHIPEDFLLRRMGAVEVQNLIFDGSQVDTQGYEVIDIGNKTVANINKVSQGGIFILGQTSIQRKAIELSLSLTKIIKDLYKKQQQKRQRHSQQANSSVGINYNQDLVVYLIGISQNLVQKVQLKDKKVKIAQQQGDEPEQQQQQGESDKRKIELISDFRLSSLPCLYRLWRGKFDMGLKDISKYQIILDD